LEKWGIRDQILAREAVDPPTNISGRQRSAAIPVHVAIW